MSDNGRAHAAHQLNASGVSRIICAAIDVVAEAERRMTRVRNLSPELAAAVEELQRALGERGK